MKRPVHEVVAGILKYGPSRVMINDAGEATTPHMAGKFYDIRPTIIFIRDDEWSLGAPAEFEERAYNTWKGGWVGYIRKPGTHMKPMEDYQNEESDND